MRTFLIIMLGWASATSIGAQGGHDECISAFFLSDVSDYCSAPGAFSTTDATGSVEINPDCWPEGTETNDLWFSFNATLPGALIQVTGLTDQGLGSLIQPALAVYSGDCNIPELIACSSVQEGQANIIELNLTDLTAGQTYFLRIDARNNNTGNFQLCIRSFIPIPSPESDCVRSVVLCDKSTIFIDNLGGTGNDNQEVGNTCVTSEFASVWYTWTAATDGNLTFTLTPNNPPDDLDFVVFLLPDGLRNCENKQVVRCMASGETLEAPPEVNLPCMGPTGLREESGDTQETLGCQPGDDNFLAPLNMVAGQSYALFINNYSQTGFGFTMEFGGTGTFLGPEPDFVIQADNGLDCDQLVSFNSTSTSSTDSIVEWFWNFGEGASPSLISGEGPHDVVYNSFGMKTAALTVESAQGCRVSEIIELDVGACCGDSSSLLADALSDDLICFESDDGRIEVFPSGGQGRYRFGLNGQGFQPGALFTGLAAGNYQVVVQDGKGCEADYNVVLGQPEPIEVMLSAGQDTVVLGFGTNLQSDVSPAERTYSYLWTPEEGISCTDCPETAVTPPGTTTFTLNVEDQDGCEGSGSYTLYTSLTRPVFAPTAIMPSSSRGNNSFKIDVNLAADRIEELAVYDRWGNQMYLLENASPQDPGYIGWDGRIGGDKALPGVYVWVARIRFIDGEVLTFGGDFTLFY